MNSAILDRLPPQDLDAERAVLAGILLRPDVLDELGNILRPDDFYADAHRRIYTHLQVLYDQKRAVDMLLLLDRLKEAGDLEAIGGAAYLGEVAVAESGATHASHYARIVLCHAQRRSIIHTATETLHTAWDMSVEPAHVLNSAEAGLAAIRTGTGGGEPVELFQAMLDLTERVDAAQKRKEHTGVLTGLEPFDAQIGGLYPGDLTILAARTSVGKTSLALQWAYDSACEGRRVLFVSLEMSRVELANKIAAGLAGLSTQRVRTGLLSDDERRRFAQATCDAGRHPLTIFDRPGQSVADIRRTARRLMKKGLRLLVVDYLGFIKPEDRRVQRYEQVGQVVAGLKGIARELEIPVLCLAQLNRQAEEGERPRLSHLRESRSIEQDADVVLLLYRPEDGINDKTGGHWDAELSVAKNRMGPTPTFRLIWDGQSTTFQRYDTGL